MDKIAIIGSREFANLEKVQSYITALHFESSRVGGCFSLFMRSNWDAAKLERFKAWKEHPERCAEETNLMATQIADALLKLFGGRVSQMVLTSPPRGKTPEGQPHAAAVLAKRVAEILGLEAIQCVARQGRDTTAHLGRSRYTNFRDTSTFVRTCPLDKMTIIIDDVTTTGNTLKRMRGALQGIPTIAFAYVVWH